MRVAVIGVGSIGRYLIEGIHAGLAGRARVVGIADIPGTEPRLHELAAKVGCPSTTDALQLVAEKPDLVVEAASQAAVRQYAVALLEAGVDTRFLRDATRGGVSAVLHELAEAARVTAVVDESALPLSESVRGACELLGLDPLYVANDGKIVAVVGAAAAERALACLRAHPLGRNAAVIGEVAAGGRHPVLVRGLLGALRVLDEPTGAPLPRIC